MSSGLIRPQTVVGEALQCTGCIGMCSDVVRVYIYRGKHSHICSHCVYTVDHVEFLYPNDFYMEELMYQRAVC